LGLRTQRDNLQLRSRRRKTSRHRRLPRAANGQSFHLTIKVSTDEQSRLIGAALQDQWKKIGVELEVRSLELATLFADLTKGNFQLSYLKWVGASNDPDVFAIVFSTKRIPPNGSNRGRYRNPKVDELSDAIRVEMNQQKRKGTNQPSPKNRS
jgi:peptide/nickel transport system substrate-binding protein